MISLATSPSNGHAKAGEMLNQANEAQAGMEWAVVAAAAFQRNVINLHDITIDLISDSQAAAVFSAIAVYYRQHPAAQQAPARAIIRFINSTPELQSLLGQQRVTSDQICHALDKGWSDVEFVGGHVEALRESALDQAWKKHIADTERLPIARRITENRAFLQEIAQQKSHESNPAFKLNWITSEEFAAADYGMRFLIRKIQVEGQCGITGGAQKVLKTSVEVDKILSLGTGTAFMGTFEIPEIVRCGFMSAESGQFTLKKIAERVAESKGVRLASANVRWEFKVPQLGLSAHLDELIKSVERDGIKYLAIDPAYMTMLVDDNGQPINFGNVFAMGAVLGKVSAAFASIGCTVQVLHHETKSAQNGRRRNGDFAPPELQDLSQSGWAEWARQWCLIGRREPYEQGTGLHRLWLNVGGSVGHGGLWSVDINEGVLQDDFSGRKWDVTVHTSAQEKAVKATASEQRKSERQIKKDDEDRGRLMQAYRDSHLAEESARTVRVAARLSGDRFTYINQILLAEGLIEPFPMTKRGQPCEAYRLKPEKPSGSLPFDAKEGQS